MLQAEDYILRVMKRADADFEGERSPGLISAAEEALGVTLPPTYRLFLRLAGCGSVGGEEIYGVVDDDFVNSSIPDAVWLTLNERGVGLPPCYVLIAADGRGGYYAIDTGAPDAEGECPVLHLPSKQRVAPSFIDFFQQVVNSCEANGA